MPVSAEVTETEAPATAVPDWFNTEASNVPDVASSAFENDTKKINEAANKPLRFRKLFII